MLNELMFNELTIPLLWQRDEMFHLILILILFLQQLAMSADRRKMGGHNRDKRVCSITCSLHLSVLNHSPYYIHF